MKTRRPDAGFSLVALIFFLTAASIFIAAAVPAYQTQAKRDLEEELIFRGQEYSRAIIKYQRRFGVYPISIDQLVSSNGLRFVRRAYKDPMNGKDFRLIYINPDGTLTGSKLFQQNINTQPMFGANNNTLNPNPNAANPNTANPNTGGNNNRLGAPNMNTPASPTGTSSFSNPFGNSGTNNTNNRPGAPNVNPGNANNNRQTNPTSTGATPFGAPQPGGQPGAGQQGASGGIIGVASDVSMDSIKIYNQRQKYDEWEFIAIMNQPGQNNPNGQNPNGQSPNGNNPFASGPGGNNPNNPSQPRTTNPNNPFGSPTNPLGGTPTGNNPFGNTNNSPGIQQPFGFGNPPQQQNQPGKR